MGLRPMEIERGASRMEVGGNGIRNWECGIRKIKAKSRAQRAKRKEKIEDEKLRRCGPSAFGGLRQGKMEDEKL